MGVYDTLVLPGTKADGEQVKCWFNQLRNIRLGDEVLPIITATDEPEWLSECCGAPPHEASDVAADNPVGFCGNCRENTGFECEDAEETHHRDYVIVMRCGGCLVVRDCKLQGYYLEAEVVPGDPPVQELPMFDKWGEAWDSSAHNRGILGEPYLYSDAAIVRTINSVARAYRYRDFGDDHDERSG